MAAVKQYILDCLRLLWMVFFRPISFQREVEAMERRQRVQLIGRAVATIIVTPFLLNLPIGLVLELSGANFNFGSSLKQVAVFVAYLVVLFVALFVLFLVVGHVEAVIVLGLVALGVVFGVVIGDAGSIVGAVVGGVALGVVGGVALGVPFGDAVGVAVSGAIGAMLSVMVGVLVSVAGGNAIGVAGGVGWFVGYFRLLEIPNTSWALWRAQRWPDQAARFLLQSLAYWDEVMLLPQPLLWRLVVAAGEADREAGMESITHLVINTHQHYAAERALLELGSRELLNCQTAAEIAERAPSSYWFSSPVVSEQMKFASEAFAQCQKIATEIASAVASSSDYQKLTTFHRARKRLEKFRQAVVLGLRGRERQNFVSIAQGWLAAVDAELDRLTREDGEWQRVPNPYLAPNPLGERSEMFLGRHVAARFVEEHFLRAGESAPLVLYGQPRIGKTSLLRNLEQRLTPDLLPVYVDMQRSAQVESTGGLLFNLAKSVAQQLVARGVHVAPPALDAFAREPFIVFDEFLDAVERAIGAPEQRLILALDEFEEIEKKLNRGTLSEDLMAYLRGMMQNRRGIRLLFAGTHTLDEMISGLWTPYFRSAVPCRVSYLDEASARTLITNPIKEFPLEYDADAVDWLIEQTHCQPCLIQLTCSVLVDQQNARKSRHAAMEDVEQALDQVVKETGEYVFRGIWDWIPAGERDVLMQVALATEPAAVAALAHALGKPEAEVRGAVERLIEAEVLLRTTPDTCCFQVPLLRRWVARRAARQGLELGQMQQSV